ncbi:hypothetical protein Taro_047733, partial [Colocasia esculenta]|nr:hypothetical protein [Colocasia esculenta]
KTQEGSKSCWNKPKGYKLIRVVLQFASLHSPVAPVLGGTPKTRQRSHQCREAHAILYAFGEPREDMNEVRGNGRPPLFQSQKRRCPTQNKWPPPICACHLMTWSCGWLILLADGDESFEIDARAGLFLGREASTPLVEETPIWQTCCSKGSFKPIELAEETGNIRVFCRIRPFLPHENSQIQPAIVSNDGKLFLQTENKRKMYNFDKVFHPNSIQEEVFSEVEPVIKSALDGYNVCIFAYGQTGTGKTFTMDGRPDCPGVVPRAMHTLFDQSQNVDCKLKFGFSMLEIYMGKLRDLLVPQKAKSPLQTPPCLSIQINHSGGIEIENLIEIRVNDFEHIKRLYRLGGRRRSTASTMSNAESSRSHCLIRISITSAASERRRTTNKLWLVDLGGSERVLKTQAKGKRLEEGKAINLSLSALGDVISSLHNKKHHVPYRNSKLTQVLRDSLGEDSKTLMLVHVNPKEEDLCETICSLGFATRVRSINLGQDEPPDMRIYKESVMAGLLQKLNHLERESQHVMKDIKELNENIDKLRQSGEKDGLNNEHIEALHLNVEDEDSSMRTSHRRDVKETSSNVPSFMRPTVCSRRKVRMSQCSKSTRKIQRVASQGTPSVYPEPMVYHMEGVLHPDKESESSISGHGHVDLKYDSEVATECSQDLSECDIKTVIFTEEQKNPSCSKTSEVCKEKHLNVDDGLLFQPKDLLSKRVLALPELGQYWTLGEQITEVVNNEIDMSKFPSVRHPGTGIEDHGYDYENMDLYISAEVQKIDEDGLKEEPATNKPSSIDILSENLLSDKETRSHQNIESIHLVRDLEIGCESEICLPLTVDKSEIDSEHTMIFDQLEVPELPLSTNVNMVELSRNSEDLSECKDLVEEDGGSSICSARYNHDKMVDQNNAAVKGHLAILSTKFEKFNRESLV